MEKARGIERPYAGGAAAWMAYLHSAALTARVCAYLTCAACHPTAGLMLSDSAMPKAIVISLVNMKGGVGKTTAAVNLAVYLVRDHQKKVLLIDLDPQTNTSLSLLSEKAWSDWADEHGTMADVFELDAKRKRDKPTKFQECIIRDVVPTIPGLDLLPGHLQLTFLDLDLAARPGRERILARKLAKLADDYDIVLCDCPPNLQTATQHALF